MFRITTNPIVPPEVTQEGAGGFVSFEGKVRDRNEGRPVQALEYEAFPPMAEAEGERILAEARAMYGLSEAVVLHRVGRLEIGETAVWIGVASPHRAEAFDGCKYIIDELKKRVPIWKKEHYADGDSDWIGCHDETVAAQTGEFYRRQVLVPEVGEQGQALLGRAKVLVVGAGGLGCAALPYLAGAGIGTIGVCDFDVVEVSNLHRQVLFGFAEAGLPKAEVAAAFVRRLNPFVDVLAITERLGRDNGRRILSDFDLVIDGTDNFEAKFVLNDLCVAAGKPLVQASLHRFEGQLLTVMPGSNGGCLRCIWPEAPYDGCVGTCAEEGVLGVVPGVFGALQANEAIKLILGIPGAATDSLVTLDLRTMEILRVRRQRREGCEACGGGQPPRGIDVPLDEALLLEMRAIDIREVEELDDIPGFRCEHFPLSDLASLHRAANTGSPVLLICEHGIRSAHAARWLREAGIEAYSLIGGADLVRRMSRR